MWSSTTVWCLSLLVLCWSTDGQQFSRQRRQGVNVGESCVTPRNVDGVCLNIKDCPLHVDYLTNRRHDPVIVQYLHDAVCLKRGAQIITCCPRVNEKSGGGGTNLRPGSECETPNQRRGTCISIRQCPELVDMLKRRQEPGVTEYLRASQCGVNNREVLACCPSRQSSGGGGGGGGGGAQLSDNRLPGIDVCGLSDVANNRVVNGRPANLGSWPWMVALGYRSPTKDLDWLCGASLINSRYVITAAHCVSNLGRRKLYLARLGDLNLDDTVADRATPIDIEIDRAIPHENYNAAQHTVDIALIRLKDRVEFTKLIRPICIPTSNTFPQDLSGYSPFVIGWGATSYRGPSTTALQEAQIDITDEASCYESYKNIKGATIDERVICALSPLGKDACQGDSGGPLILPKQSNTVNFYLIGVVSYGYKCAEPGFPGIYSKVSLYTDWIKRNMS